MKLTLPVILTFGFLVACGGREDEQNTNAPAAGVEESSPVFDMPYLMRDLDNGLRVVIVETDYPDIVTLQIPVQTGARNDVEPGKSGFAHFFEHMMFRGTPTYSSDAYNAIVKAAGASSNAFTIDDYTNYHLTFTKADLEKIIEIEADRFMNLSYSEADFRTEALAVKGEYLKDYSSPVLKAFERIRALSFDVHPYHYTSMGSIEDIETMPEQLEYSRTFFDRWYRPEYTTVIVVGDVDAEETYQLVERYWGEWQPGTEVIEIPQEPARSEPRFEHIQWASETQPWLFIGFQSPPYVSGAPDFPAMSILDSVYFSDSSDLYQQLVIDGQMADLLLTDFPLNKDPNLNLIYIRLTDEAHAAHVEANVLHTLARARTERIAADKLEQTKKRLRYAFVSELDNADSIGSMLAEYVQLERTPEIINDIYRQIESMTAEDVRTVADRWFTDDTRVTVTLSASSAMEGIGSSSTIDELVADWPIVNVPSTTTQMTQAEAETFTGSGERLPVSIVAMPSDSSPLVDVSFLFHSGAASDPDGKKGLASLTASMLTEAGSATWSIQEINDAMYPIASGFYAQVDKEMTTLSGQVHKDNLDTWYRYVRSQLLNPGWRESDFERVKTQLNNEIRTDLVGDNDEELGKEVMYSSIYGDSHPYGSLNEGHSSDVANLTLDDVRAFYSEHFSLSNLTVGLAGGFPASFVEQLGDDLQSLPAGSRNAVSLPALPDATSHQVTIVEKETSGVAVSFGFPIELKRGDPDWVALWLARSWLGEHRSENSHLYQRIREARGMNYGNYAYVEYFPEGMDLHTPPTNLGRQHQVFQVWLRPLRNNNDAHFATRAAIFEMDKLIENGMSETEFETTRAFLSKSVSLLTDGQSRQLGYELDSRFYEIEGFSDYVRSALDQLTLDDVNRVIRENLKTDNMHFAFVTADAADLADRLVNELASPMAYDTDQSDALLAEDAEISGLPLDIGESDVEIIQADEVFR